jgi:hypothetical protein
MTATLVRFPDSHAAANDPDTLLAAGISPSDLTVTFTTEPPALGSYTSGQFAILIRTPGGGSEEWLLIDSYNGSLVATVNASGRGYAGSTAASHVTNDEILFAVLEEDFVRVTDGRNISPAQVKVNADWGYDDAAIITAALTANQDDYAPTGYAKASVICLDPDADRTITGFTAPSPEYARRVVFENIDSVFTVTFTAEDAGSTAANRFGVASDVTVGPKQNVEWLYDTTLNRWLLIGGTGSGGSSFTISVSDPADTAATADPGASTTEISAADHVHQLGDHTHASAGGEGGPVSWDDLTDKPSLPSYTPTNVTTDRAYDADATTVDELADVLGTLISDLGAAGMGVGGGGTLTSFDDALGADITITTGGTYYDVLSRSLTAGTWLIEAQVFGYDSGSSPYLTAKLWDGSTVYSSGEVSLPAANNVNVLSLKAIAILGSTTTVKVSATARNNASKIVAAIFDPAGAGNTATRLTCVRLDVVGGGVTLPAYLTFIPPPVTGWTWDNQGGSTVDYGASDVRFHFLGNAAELRGMYRAAPSTPYTVSVALNHLLGLGSSGTAPRTGISLSFKETSSNKIIDLVLVWYDQGSYLQITRWNSATSSVLNVFNNSWLDDALREPTWFRIEDDGTNIKFYLGLKRIDAIEWVQVYTEARGAFFTSHPDSIGIYGYVETGDVYGTLLSYEEA